jgi:hypothetical protein
MQHYSIMSVEIPLKHGRNRFETRPINVPRQARDKQKTIWKQGALLCACVCVCVCARAAGGTINSNDFLIAMALRLGKEKEETPLLRCHFVLKQSSFYQDRLGTK